MQQQQQQGVVSQKAEQLSKSVAAATIAFATPAFAANESISDVALANVNILGVIAVALFILIPVSFLVILYVKSAAEGNVSGGFSQSYYDESKRQGKKLANEAAAIKGAGGHETKQMWRLSSSKEYSHQTTIFSRRSRENERKRISVVLRGSE